MKENISGDAEIRRNHTVFVQKSRQQVHIVQDVNATKE